MALSAVLSHLQKLVVILHQNSVLSTYFYPEKSQYQSRIRRRATQMLLGRGLVDMHACECGLQTSKTGFH